MRNILTIARCEFVEMLKTKTFLFSVLFAPLMMGGILFFAEKITRRPAGPRAPLVVGIADFSGQMQADIKQCMDDYNTKNPSRQIQLETLPVHDDPNTAEQQGKTHLRQGKWNLYAVIDSTIITGGGKVHFYTYKSKPSDTDMSWTIENMIHGVVVEYRCKARNIPSQLLNEIRHVPSEHIEIGESAGQQRKQSKGDIITRMMVPFFMMFMIYMGIMTIGGQILGSVIEEKSSRIIEILISSVSPFELMAGKILGLCAVGLAVVTLWTAAAFGTARSQNLPFDISSLMFVYFMIYFVLGFILLGSLMAAMGSLCTTTKESQSLMTPVVLLLILPIISWFNLVQSPNGLYARVLSYIPPLTPLVMVLRLSSTSDVPIIEIIASIIVLFAATLGTIWLAGRVFRTGILMYGKRPSLREIFRWLRQS